jgi:hypothetical protein
VHPAAFECPHWLKVSVAWGSPSAKAGSGSNPD